MNRKQAKNELVALIDVIEKLSATTAFSAEHVRWRDNVLIVLDEIFGENRYFHSIANLTWSKSNFMIGGVNDPLGSFDPQAAIEREHHKEYLRQLEVAKGILQSAIDRIDRENDFSSLKKQNEGVISEFSNVTEKELQEKNKTLEKENSNLKQTIKLFRYLFAIILFIGFVTTMYILQTNDDIWFWLQNHPKSLSLKLSGFVFCLSICLIIAEDRLLRLGFGGIAIGVFIGILQII